MGIMGLLIREESCLAGAESACREVEIIQYSWVTLNETGLWKLGSGICFDGFLMSSNGQCHKDPL